jgi:hypothetical protein
MIHPHLDRFQHMKYGRMKFLLEELEQAKDVKMDEWLGNIAVLYGIARETGLKYIRDWVAGGFVVVNGDVIKFIKKPEDWK